MTFKNSNSQIFLIFFILLSASIFVGSLDSPISNENETDGLSIELWSTNITAPNTVQNLTIGVSPNATEDLDSCDSWSLPPWPIDKVFMILDSCCSKNIKQNKNGAAWELVVIVPWNKSASLDWNPYPAENISVKIIGEDFELFPGQELSEGTHRFTIYATVMSSDPKPVIYLEPPSRAISETFALSGTISDNNLVGANYKVDGVKYDLPFVLKDGIASFHEELNLADGEHVIEIEAVDSGFVNKTFNVTIDDTNPDIITNISVRGNDVLVKVSAHDENLISRIDYDIRGPMYWNYDRSGFYDSDNVEETFREFNLNPGKYTVEVTVVDVAWNEAVYTTEFEIEAYLYEAKIAACDAYESMIDTDYSGKSKDAASQDFSEKPTGDEVVPGEEVPDHVSYEQSPAFQLWQIIFVFSFILFFLNLRIEQ
jgi:hypothetical protein